MARAQKPCPVCDSLIDAAAKKCPTCQADLTLFDVDTTGMDVEKIQMPANKSIDDILDSIVGEEKEPSDLLEQVKALGKNGTAAGAVVFECPNCGKEVAESDKACPHCGALFAEQVQCPSCNATVDAGLAACPQCGSPFPPPAFVGTEGEAAVVKKTAPPVPAVSAEVLKPLMAARKARPPEPLPATKKELYAELPRLVAEVKSLLVTAREVGVPAGGTKKLISDAVTSGKAGNIEKAVALVREAKTLVGDLMTEQLGRRAEDVMLDLQRARAMGSDVSAAEAKIGEAVQLLRRDSFGEGLHTIQEARELFDRVAGPFRRAREAVDRVEGMVDAALEVGLQVEDATTLLSEAKRALGRRDWSTSYLFAQQAGDSVQAVLPQFINKEILRVGDTLKNLMKTGVNIKRPTGTLKHAKISYDRGDFLEALKYIKALRTEMTAFTPPRS